MSSAADDPQTRKVGWSRAEDVIVVKGVRRFGSDWPTVCNLLPGRTFDAVRNRYHRLCSQHSQAELEQMTSAQMGPSAPPELQQPLPARATGEDGIPALMYERIR
eukprot:3920716-Prymnesium_polylepis.1